MDPTASPPPEAPAPPDGVARPSNPRLATVRSAAREAPLPKTAPEGPLKERLKSGSLDVVLNAASVLREVAEDFRNRDRHFKLKAAILAGWVLLSVTSLGVACQPQGHSSGALGARWVLAGEARRPVFSIYNDGDEPWEDVVVVINGHYRAAQALVVPGGNVTLVPKQLIGPDGTSAPGDLRATEVELRTADGRELLVRAGEELR